MVSAGKVATTQTFAGAITVVGATVTLARSAVGIAVVTTHTLVALTTVRVRYTRTLSGLEVTECVFGAQVIALANWKSHTIVDL